jgi:hypothetical protein
MIDPVLQHTQIPAAGPPAPVFHPVSRSAAAPEPSEGAYELKFVLPDQVVEPLLARARSRIPMDPHAGPDGTYHIQSLYLDTPVRDVYHRSPGYRDSKYRVRRYGSESVLYLERKLKRRAWVRKQRTVIPDAELARLAVGKAEEGWAGFWFHDRVAELSLVPCCRVVYRRFACVGHAEGSPIRLTLDREIRCAPANGFTFVDPDSAGSVPSEVAVLELKFRHTLPLVFKDLVRDFALEPVSASKYRRSMELCRLVSQPLAPSKSRERESGNK